MRKPIYLFVYLIPLTVLYSFSLQGFWSFLPLFIFFGLVPLLELVIPPKHANLPATEVRRRSQFFDWVLYLSVPVHIGLLVYFLVMVSTNKFTLVEYVGYTFSMGLMCGVFGINIAHELGHRSNRFERFLAEIMLLSSLEMHFLPYHNLGHHTNVATPDDPATARKNESVFAFWFRSQIGSYFEAWRLEAYRLSKKGDYSIFQNKAFIYTVIQYSLLFVIYFVFGLKTLIVFIGAAIIGILLLETVNYIEHYGMLRQKNEAGRYERVRNYHSWNSDHPLGRAMLFELSRHSDHHFKASKKYQVLESYEDNPQMPTGYPGMMLLSLLPPLWFKVMNKRLSGKY
jgi:alkane 1-monooxygenase